MAICPGCGKDFSNPPYDGACCHKCWDKVVEEIRCMSRIEPQRSAEDRYQSDVEFRALVDMIYKFIAGGNYTPSELREAVILAATKYENQTFRAYMSWVK